MKILGFGFVAASLLLASVPAYAETAPTRDQCFDAHEKSQLEKKDGKLRAALEDLKICSNAACPKLVRGECTTFQQEIEKSLPSVRVSVKRADGGSTEGTRVAIDGGEAIALPTDPVPLDPGDHVFRFDLDGRTSEQKVSLSAGQREVAVIGEFAAAEKPAAPAPTPSAPEAPPSRSVSPVVYVLGGVAVIGIAGFIGFGLAGKSAESDLDACKPNCAADDVHDMRRKYLFADISLGVAVVAAGAGAYLYFKQPKKSEGVSWVRAAPNRSGGGVLFGTSF